MLSGKEILAGFGHNGGAVPAAIIGSKVMGFLSNWIRF